MDVQENEFGTFVKDGEYSCCWVNTDQPAVKIRRLGFFRYWKEPGFGGGSHKVHFSELCELYYKHPQAPEDATVSLLNWLPVVFPPGFEQTAMNIIDGMQGLGKVAKLDQPPVIESPNKEN